MGKIALQHCFAEGFLRAKIVIERPFGHASGSEQLTETHAGKTKAQAERFAGSEQMFSGIPVAIRLFCHNENENNRPIGLGQVADKKTGKKIPGSDGKQSTNLHSIEVLHKTSYRRGAACCARLVATALQNIQVGLILTCLHV